MFMFGRFTERAQQVLVLAQEEAKRLNHNFIGTEHLLLGLVREGSGIAARVLQNMSVDLSRVRSEVEQITPKGEKSSISFRNSSSGWGLLNPRTAGLNTGYLHFFSITSCIRQNN